MQDTTMYVFTTTIVTIGIVISTAILSTNTVASNRHYQEQTTQRMTICLEEGNAPIECTMAAELR